MIKADFGWAIQQLKAGKRVRRAGWNGKGMYLWLLPERGLGIGGGLTKKPGPQ